jgi:hypothetical protein
MPGSKRNPSGRTWARSALTSLSAPTCYRFTFILWTKYLRCIEWFVVFDKTARTLRNEMKIRTQRFEENREKMMKITTAVKASMFTAALGLACLLPATAHAQVDVSPDFYPIANTETIAPQPAQVASAKPAKADFEGKFSLPYDAKCSGKNLKSGKYLLSVKSDGRGRVVTIHRSGEEVSVRVREVPRNRAGSQSALLVRKSDEGRRLEAVYVEGLNAMLYLETDTMGSHGRMERLPIS